MARRAKSSTGGRTTPEAAPAERAKPAAAKAPRRGRKPKLPDMEPSDRAPADISVTDAFFPGGEEPVETSAARDDAKAPAKARRVRKQRSVELAAETLATDDEHAEETAAPPAETSADETDGSDHDAAPPAPASPSVENADAKAAASAVRWDADTGTASFDWPAIEAVAAAAGPNQAMAKLLLAARAEGANSRWPF